MFISCFASLDIPRTTHHALIIIPLFITQTPTCFGTYVPSSGSVLYPCELLESPKWLCHQDVPCTVNVGLHRMYAASVRRKPALFPRSSSGLSMQLTAYLRLMLKLRTSGATLPVLLTPAWDVQHSYFDLPPSPPFEIRSENGF
jgi:hypothetical protein